MCPVDPKRPVEPHTPSLREIYRKDRQANRLNKQGKYKRLRNVREDNLIKWGH
jgi:hypothetical protein